ncbi:hypothetical protein NC652_019296 [Populus alba x Populus x berolinensis]|nr:hypothetical protein NC652_019296 [Populus alba x Populus x berolinensis]
MWNDTSIVSSPSLSQSPSPSPSSITYVWICVVAGGTCYGQGKIFRFCLGPEKLEAKTDERWLGFCCEWISVTRGEMKV